MTRTPTRSEGYHPWTTYIRAREEARRRGDRKVGTEHLLVGLLSEPGLATVLGVSLDAGRRALATLDHQALALVGIDNDLDPPPLPTRPVPALPTVRAVLTDRLPMTPSAKLALQQAGKPMHRGHRITPGDVLEVLLHSSPPEPAAALLAALGVDAAAAIRRLQGHPAA